MKRAAGFTLIEVLVVMVILGVLATSITLALPGHDERDRTERLQALCRQAQRAARLAEVKAGAFAWTLDVRQGRIQERQQGEWLDWRDVHDRPQPATAGLPLGNSLALVGVEVEGQARPLASRIVFLPGEPPLFVVRFAGGGRRWRIEGEPSGVIRLAEEAEARG